MTRLGGHPAADRAAPGRSRTKLVGVVLVVVGLALLALYRLTIGNEPHSYADGSSAPTRVQLRAAQNYSIGIAGGVGEMKRLGIDPAVLACTIGYPSTSNKPLKIAADAADTKATNQIATFTAPLSGRAHVECSGLPPVFVDNAEDAGFDTADLFLVLACLALAVGAPLLMSALRRPARYTSIGIARGSQPSA